MANERPQVPAAIKRTLLEEAGGRCINPGCANERVHLHHLEEWAVYQTHDERDMIAICPACHDAVHFGSLAITDDTLRQWKAAGQGPRKSDLLYVEPGRSPLIKLGQISITAEGNEGLHVFTLGPSNHLSYKIEDGDMTLATIRVADAAGETIVRMQDNRVRWAPEFQFAKIPGRFALSGPVQEILDETWMIDAVRTRIPDFGTESEAILDCEVVAAGQIAVRGVWRDGDRILVVRDQGWVVPSPTGEAALYTGSGTIHWTNPDIFGLFAGPFRLWA